ncbi:MAG: class I SAM-dependent methyltransferase [Brevefilum sp.]
MNNDHNTPYEQARDGNRALWDELTPVHLRSYCVERFLTGERWLPEKILEEVGPVQGLSLLHLQCHFGLDTLAWAREGARATGVDFSPIAIDAALELSDRAEIPARFICTDIYNLPQVLDETFDIVFTSIGVLCWLKDLNRWAQIIARFLKPGGMFYIMDGHPFLYTFDDEGRWQFQIPYFHNEDPYIWDEGGPDYMDPSYISHTPSYEWQWTVSDIINAILGAGLRLEFFNEFGALSDPVYPDMTRREDGLYTFGNMPVPLPILFSLRARREE